MQFFLVKLNIMSQNRKQSPFTGSLKKGHQSNYSVTQDSFTKGSAKGSVFSGSKRAFQVNTGKKSPQMSPLRTGTDQKQKVGFLPVTLKPWVIEQRAQINVSTATGGMRDKHLKNRRNTDFYAIKPDYKSSDFDVVLWTQEPGLLPLKKSNKIKIQHQQTEFIKEWANDNIQMKKIRVQENLRKKYAKSNSRQRSKLDNRNRTNSAHSSPKPVVTTHLNELSTNKDPWRINLQKFRAQSKDSDEDFYIPNSQKSQNTLTLPQIQVPEKSNHLMTTKNLKSGHKSPQNSADVQELPLPQKRKQQTDESINDPFNLSGSAFTDIGSINLITQIKTIQPSPNQVKTPLKSDPKRNESANVATPHTAEKNFRIAKLNLQNDIQIRTKEVTINSQKAQTKFPKSDMPSKSGKTPSKLPESANHKSSLDIQLEKANANQNMKMQSIDQLQVYKPEENPAFFNIFIEKRHADQLQKRNLDHESRLEVIYMVLKDQLRRAKKDLLAVKKDRKEERLAAEQIKKRMALAVEKAQAKGKHDSALLNKIQATDKINSQGVAQYQIDQGSTAQMPKDFKRIVKHLMHTEVRKHNRFCPCCKTYDDGNDLNPQQMGEFLEYIRQLHYKLIGGPPKNWKRVKHPDETLEFDSVSEITDLSNEGILASSMHKLDKEDQQRLNRYVQEMRALQKYQPPKHDCLSKKKKTKIENSRVLMEMELKVKQEEFEMSDKEGSAHQFSVRSVSLQADSLEQFEIDMQTDLIDLKNTDQQVDIYDLGQARHMLTQAPSNIGFRTMVDRAVGTDYNRKMLSTTDWFYCNLNRRLIREYLTRQGISTQEVEAKFQIFDKQIKNKFRPVIDPISGREERENGFQVDVGTSAARKNGELMSSIDSGLVRSDSLTNPQDPIQNEIELKQLSEPEVAYLIQVLKQQVQKYNELDVLTELHAQAGYTAKMLTKELIEGKTPICYQIEQHGKIEKENVILLLTRCQKLYQSRQDVQRILILLIKFYHDKERDNRSKQESDQLLRRIKSILGQFQTENKFYQEHFLYDGKDLYQHIEKLLTGAEMPTPNDKQAFDRKIKEMLKSEAKNDKSIGYGDVQSSIEAVNMIEQKRHIPKVKVSRYEGADGVNDSSNKEQYMKQVHKELLSYQPQRNDPAFVRPTQIMLSSTEEKPQIEGEALQVRISQAISKQTGRLISRAQLLSREQMQGLPEEDTKTPKKVTRSKNY